MKRVSIEAKLRGDKNLFTEIQRAGREVPNE